MALSTFVALKPFQGQYEQYSQGLSDNVSVIAVIVSVMRGGLTARSITIWQFEARSQEFPAGEGKRWCKYLWRTISAIVRDILPSHSRENEERDLRKGVRICHRRRRVPQSLNSVTFNVSR